MDRKYELTDESILFEGSTLYRIRALMDFGSVRIGDIGGWVESESNLSQDGACWVCGDARVLGNAVVLDNATVSDSVTLEGNTVVRDYADISGSLRITEGYFGGDSIVSSAPECGYFVFKNTWSDYRTYTYVVSIDTWFSEGFFDTSDALIEYGYRDCSFSGVCYERWVNTVNDAVSLL